MFNMCFVFAITEMRLEMFIDIYLTSDFQEILSSVITPRNLISCTRSITTPYIWIASWTLESLILNIIILLLIRFRDNLFSLNHLLTLMSFRLTIWHNCCKSSPVARIFVYIWSCIVRTSNCCVTILQLFNNA